jgi:hypothetical protein
MLPVVVRARIGCFSHFEARSMLLVLSSHGSETRFELFHEWHDLLAKKETRNAATSICKSCSRWNHHLPSDLFLGVLLATKSILTVVRLVLFGLQSTPAVVLPFQPPNLVTPRHAFRTNRCPRHFSRQINGSTYDRKRP